jgi:hypothetical protein
MRLAFIKIHGHSLCYTSENTTQWHLIKGHNPAKRKLALNQTLPTCTFLNNKSPKRFLGGKKKRPMGHNYG